MLNNVGHSAFSFASASFLMSSRRSRKRFFQNTNLSGSSLLGRTRHVNINPSYFCYSLLCVSGYKDVIFCWLLFQKEGDPDPCFLHQVFLDRHPEVAELRFRVRLPSHGLQLISYNLHKEEKMLGKILACAKIVWIYFLQEEGTAIYWVNLKCPPSSRVTWRTSSAVHRESGERWRENSAICFSPSPVSAESRKSSMSTCNYKVRVRLGHGARTGDRHDLPRGSVSPKEGSPLLARPFDIQHRSQMICWKHLQALMLLQTQLLLPRQHRTGGVKMLTC